jgi:5-(carboxyamino)imidazole ribonucleotide synthase
LHIKGSVFAFYFIGPKTILLTSIIMKYRTVTMLCKDTDIFDIGNPICVGIIGGGQLGKMIAQEAKRMSLKVLVLDPQQECPASTVADQQIVADYKDEKAIERLASRCDILTYEIELANSIILKQLESSKYEIHPSAETLNIIQNKYRQKSFFKKNNLAVPDFDIIGSEKELKQWSVKYGFPFILKACEDSYDGRGNIIIRSESELAEHCYHLNGNQYMVEEFIDFKKELSIMVARNKSGQIESFPVAENIHRNNILDTTIVPARVSRLVQQKVSKLAEKAVHVLSGSGIFGIEIFLTQNDQVLINEVSPRPHNSGHYTIEACSISQFEQHLRAILDLPLSKPELLSPVVMSNILGSSYWQGPYRIKGLKKFFSIHGTTFHLYGKKISKPNRKIGHITVTASTLQDALVNAKKAKTVLKLEKVLV